MTVKLFSIAAILLYLLASGRLALRIFRSDNAAEISSSRLYPLAVVALLLHTWVLYRTLFTPIGLDLGFYHALSLIGWMVAIIVVLIGWRKPVENLMLVFLPLTAMCMTMAMLLPGEHIVTDSASIGLRMHILLSISAYSLLAIAALQAVVLAVQNHQIRNKKPVRMMQILPPMQTMEELLVQVLAIGFILLSLSLATGLMFVHNFFAQHLVHKTTLSILAWAIFGVVLWGRWRLGWRGKMLIRWTVGGFISLMFAYFGSKLVLELILHRG